MVATKAKLLRLSWMDSTGDAYHEEFLSPSAAREQLKRSGAKTVRISGVSSPLARLSHKAISESSRGAVVAVERGEVLVTLATD
jgi:hypothetical protein